MIPFVPIYFSYIAKRFLKTLIITLCVLFVVVFLIEIAVYFPFKSSQDMFMHLTGVFFKRLELLTPLSFLISTINVLAVLQKNNELLAMQVSGISKSKITAPFFAVSLIISALLYLNYQLVLPVTSPWLLEEQKRSTVKSSSSDEYQIRFLSDGSRIIYTVSNLQLNDLFWVKSHNEIWHCEQIIFEDQLPIGMYVDKLEKPPHGQFKKTASFHKYALPSTFLKAKPKVEKKNALSIGTLISLMTKHSLSITSDKGFVYSLLCYKMINPWFPTMVVTAIIPYLLTYRRRIKTSNIYLLGTLAFFLFHTLVKACIILAEHYVVSPLFTIIFLPLLLQGMLSFKLWRSIVPKPQLQAKESLKKASLLSV